MIEVLHLSKIYSDLSGGDFAAVDDIDFNVNPGEIFGLIGPNGAGKTTTLRILSTMLKPSSGTVRVCGIDVEANPEAVRSHIGFMSANTAVYDRMSGWEMVEHFGLLCGMEKNTLHERMEELFSRLKMEDVRDRLGAKMSSGMKQKVSIARALIHDPPVLIFDEPTVGLDVLVARSLLGTIAELKDAGKCVLFSTHIMREVEKLCDRIAIIYRGKILASGTLEMLREKYGQDDLEELFFRLISEYDNQNHILV